MAVNRGSSLMKYFSADSKLVGHLSLEQHAREPKILVTCTALVDPIAATAINGPIAEALLKPYWKEYLDVTCAEAAIFVASGQVDLRKYRHLRSPTLTVLLDEPILEADRRIAVAELHRASGRTVECCNGVNRELSIGDDPVVDFNARQSASRIVAHDCPR